MKMFDSIPLNTVDTIELHNVADELAAHMRHPSVQHKPVWLAQAEGRLQELESEFYRRWQGIWGEEKALDNTLSHIYRIFT
ncbi:hypothetical protein [Mycolicibacterium septicum]|uniref:hypothetical protein n=1 Tax=Mycolicibacterium septicum TaxID=98668 RepID=UPI001AF515D0|nr:hypothetical protein [Mycolicibacterium septicum]QRY51762.1 hypothetical protein JVX95_31050 [Mycolicibacterium septicum]